MKDTGRLTYHEILLAFRRSQRTRSRCSSRASRLPTSSSKSSQSQSTKQTPNHTDDESFHFDYLPNQQSPPEQSRRNDFESRKHKTRKSSLPDAHPRPGYDHEHEPEAISDDDFAFPPPPEKNEPVYIRPSFPEKRNSRTRQARRDKYPSSVGAKNAPSSKIQEENRTPLSSKRTYDQSAYG